jgi:chorismate dehydratase
MSVLRLASVHYVNALPLTWGFERGAASARTTIAREAPARIAERLRTGAADVGLIPSIEFQNLEDARILPQVCIASRERARSVYLASRVPLPSIRSVALDASSRTSAALLKIILAHKGLNAVTFVEHPPALEEMLARHDAALLIGDAALAGDTAGLRVHDLAAEWRAITGLPFVFAVWAVRAGTILIDGTGPFVASRQAGLEHVADIAAEAGKRLGLAPATVEEYLSVNIHYDLGSDEARALDLFFRQAHELGLVPGHRPPIFYGTAGDPAAERPGAPRPEGR